MGGDVRGGDERAEPAPGRDQRAGAGRLLEQHQLVPRLAGERGHAAVLRPRRRGGQGARLLRARQGRPGQGVQGAEERCRGESDLEIVTVASHSFYTLLIVRLD